MANYSSSSPNLQEVLILYKNAMLLSHQLLTSGSISCIPKQKPLATKNLWTLLLKIIVLSKTLVEYGVQKSTSISTARCLAEILGHQIMKNQDLACKFIIAVKLMGAPVTECAVPVAIFRVEERKGCTFTDG